MHKVTQFWIMKKLKQNWSIITKSFYQNLQLTEHQAINRVTQHIPALITPEQNQALMRPIMQEEVDQEVKEMPLGKSPGPDGFTTDFFHHCWSMIREEVWKLVEESQLQVRCSQPSMPLFSPSSQRGMSHQPEAI
jgi:hypothetical protein